jgi:hypothetical protein
MTLGAAESRGEKCFDQFPGECVTDYEAPEADQIQSGVLGALARGRGFVTQAGPNPGHLVRDDW